MVISPNYISVPQIEVAVIPAKQENNCTTFLYSLEDKERIYKHLEDISVNVEIDEFGRVKEHP